ncbi:hypothetical protein, partial [Thermogutta sp.]|uniref:hypothetical protein n=1 Tax=Thermogutta sp. TaxID=1962930 RepID=UPI003C7C41BD
MNVEHRSSESMATERDQKTRGHRSRGEREIKAIVSVAGFFVLGLGISAVAFWSGVSPRGMGYLQLLGRRADNGSQPGVSLPPLQEPPVALLPTPEPAARLENMGRLLS